MQYGNGTGFGSIHSAVSPEEDEQPLSQYEDPYTGPEQEIEAAEAQQILESAPRTGHETQSSDCVDVAALRRL